jgi:hypothetical protein
MFSAVEADVDHHAEENQKHAEFEYQITECHIEPLFPGTAAIKKAPVSVQNTEGELTPRYHLFLPPCQGRSPDTFISFALYRAPPAFLLPLRVSVCCSGGYFRKRIPAASHRPAAL